MTKADPNKKVVSALLEFAGVTDSQIRDLIKGADDKGLRFAHRTIVLPAKINIYGCKVVLGDGLALHGEQFHNITLEGTDDQESQ